MMQSTRTRCCISSKLVFHIKNTKVLIYLLPVLLSGSIKSLRIFIFILK